MALTIEQMLCKGGACEAGLGLIHIEMTHDGEFNKFCIADQRVIEAIVQRTSQKLLQRADAIAQSYKIKSA